MSHSFKDIVREMGKLVEESIYNVLIFMGLEQPPMVSKEADWFLSDPITRELYIDSIHRKLTEREQNILDEHRKKMPSDWV